MSALEGNEPIIAALDAYFEGVRQFNFLPDDVADEQASIDLWRRPWDVLKRWDKPCTTREGAIAALKFAADDAHHDGFEIAPVMMRAALAYLEKEHASPRADLASAPTIASLFEEWQGLSRRASDFSLSLQEMEAASNAAAAVEKQMHAIWPVTAEDLAKKLVADTLAGDCPPGDELMSEIMVLSGHQRGASS